MSLMIERAEQIKASIEQALAGHVPATTFEHVTVTLDPHKIPSGSRHGVVCILPPVLNLSTFDQTEADWDVLVCAGPPDNMPAAWAKISAIVDVCRTTDVAFSSAVPDSYRSKDGQTIPAYMLSLTETLTD